MNEWKTEKQRSTGTKDNLVISANLLSMTNTIHYPKSNYNHQFPPLYRTIFISAQTVYTFFQPERETDRHTDTYTHPFLLTPRFHELIPHYSNAISQEYPEGLTISAVSNSLLLFLFEPTPIRLLSWNYSCCHQWLPPWTTQQLGTEAGTLMNSLIHLNKFITVTFEQIPLLSPERRSSLSLDTFLLGFQDTILLTLLLLHWPFLLRLRIVSVS